MADEQEKLMEAESSPEPLAGTSASFLELPPRREDNTPKTCSRIARCFGAYFWNRKSFEDIEMFDVGSINDVVKKDQKEKKDREPDGAGKEAKCIAPRDIFDEGRVNLFEKKNLLDETSSDED